MTATRSDGTGARRAGAAAVEFDLTAHWRERARGREGWDNAPALVRDLSTRFTATVAEAIERAGGVPGRTETEFVAATWYGTSHVAEVMHEQLREAGPKWLDPEQFLHYSPHAMVSAAALDLGLGGASVTLVGPDAEFQAVAHAVRRIRSGRAATVVVAEYEALTPFAAAPCPDGPGTAAGAPPKGRATALVLTAGGGRGLSLTVHRSGDGDGDGDGADASAGRGGTTVRTAGPGLLRLLADAAEPLVVVSRAAGLRDALVLG
ncbi:beta-ketoacyl synthase N-terminal-like domain-containing protein [Streptomyces anulatus]|uniref:beta-ketoacyl synthase N-terminal-like domain-containing protein n=1 Tax=Streptomyces anulatus TaxID=1892 RepID=UPI00342B1054